MTVYDLYGGYELKGFLSHWDEYRRCPVPLIDFLLDHGLEDPAACARWCAERPDYPVYYPDFEGGERGGTCGPYPGFMHGQWVFREFDREFTPFAHRIPSQSLFVAENDPHPGDIRRDAPIDAVLALLDLWRVSCPILDEPSVPKTGPNTKRRRTNSAA
jgi:hypothetical protein